MWIWDYCKANNLTQNESAVVRSVCLSLIAMCRSHTPHVQTTLAASTLLSSLSGPRNKFSHWLTHNKVANHNTFFELVTKKCSWEITMDLCYQCLQVWKKQKQFDALKREREREKGEEWEKLEEKIICPFGQLHHENGLPNSRSTCPRQSLMSSPEWLYHFLHSHLRELMKMYPSFALFLA